MDNAAAVFAQAIAELAVFDAALALEKTDSLDDSVERNLLLFDEVVPLHILLRLPNDTTMDIVKELAQRISLSIEVSSSSNKPERSDLAAPPLVRRDSNNRQTRGEQTNLILSKVLGTTDVPIISVHRGQPVVVWTSDITIRKSSHLCLE